MRTFTTRKTITLALAATALAGGVSAGSIAQAQAADTHNYPAKVDINGRQKIGQAADAPGHVENQYKKGAKVPVTCQQYDGSDLWDKTADKTWVPDKYVKTGTDGRVSGLPDCAGGSTSAGQTPKDDFDHKTYGFAANNCTAFAAFRVVHRLGISGFQNDWHGQHFGNAGTWDDAARKAGVKVDKTPSVGGIAVNDVHKVGHVAYINKVYKDGSFDVEEYNWNHPLKYGTRSHVKISNAQADFQHVIHFA